MAFNIEHGDRSNTYKTPILWESGSKSRKSVLVSFKKLFDDDGDLAYMYYAKTTPLSHPKIWCATALFCLLLDVVKSQLSRGISMKHRLSTAAN